MFLLHLLFENNLHLVEVEEKNSLKSKINCRYVGTGGTIPINLGFTGGLREHIRLRETHFP